MKKRRDVPRIVNDKTELEFFKPLRKENVSKRRDDIQQIKNPREGLEYGRSS